MDALRARKPVALTRLPARLAEKGAAASRPRNR